MILLDPYRARGKVDVWLSRRSARRPSRFLRESSAAGADKALFREVERSATSPAFLSRTSEPPALAAAPSPGRNDGYPEGGDCLLQARTGYMLDVQAFKSFIWVNHEHSLFVAPASFISDSDTGAKREHVELYVISN